MKTRVNATPKPPWFTTPRVCGFCGERAAAPQYLGLAGYCSRSCLLDSLGETDSDVGD